MSFIKGEISRDLMEDFRKLSESMAPSDKSFAISLASQFEKNGLSTKQIWWVHELMERYVDKAGTTGTMTPKKKQYASQDIGAVGPLFELFRKAAKRGSSHLILRIMVDGRQLKLTQMDEGKPININEYPIQGKIWHGALEPSGKLSLTEKCKFPEALTQVLKEIAADPSQATGKIGKKMKCCCFCGISLSTTDSLYYGYGPICAENYGLEWGNAKSHIRKETLGDAVQEMQNVKLF